MAGEAQYINPIIQAMGETSKRQAHAKDLTEKTRSAKAEENHRQQQLAQQEAQFEKQHELGQRELDLHTQTLKQAYELQNLNKLKELFGIAQAGGDVGAMMGGSSTGGEGPNSSNAPQVQIPTVTNPNAQTGKVNIPGLGLIDPKAFGSPEQANQNLQARFKAQAAGTSEGSEPTDTRRAEADFKKQLEITNRQETVAAANRASMERVSADDRRSREKVAQANNATRIAVANLGLSASLAPDSNVIDDIYVTGNRTLPGGKIGISIEGAAPKGWTPVTKADTSLFENVVTAKKLIDDARVLASNSYDTNPGEALKTAVGIGEGGATKNRVEGLLGNLARYFGQERGVLTEKDVDRAKKLIYSPRLSEAQNLKNVGELENLLNEKIALVTKKYPKDQLEAIMSRRGLDASKYGGATTPKVENWTKDPKTGKLVMQ